MRPLRCSIWFSLLLLVLTFPGCFDEGGPDDTQPPALILLTDGNIVLGYEGRLPIRVRYEEDGRSVGGEEIVFEIPASSVVGDLGNTVLSDELVVTDSDVATRGEATTWVEAGTTESGFLVHARVAGDQTMDPVAVQVQVVENISGVSRLHLLTEAEPVVSFDMRVPVKVRYLDPQDNPIPNTFITFEPMSGVANTRLSNLNSQTDAEGIAETVIEAGNQEIDFQIKISVFGNDSVQPLIVSVSIKPKDSLDYIIRVQYDGPVTLNRVEVLLYDVSGQCNDLVQSPTQPPSEDVAFTTVVILPDAAGNLADHNLGVPGDFAGFQYAVARGEPTKPGGEGTGYFSTWGCIDSIAPPEPDSATVILIDLHELWPAMQGDYHITSSMDILDIIPDNLQQMLQFFGGFFDDPGLWILELIAASSDDTYWDQGAYQTLFDLCTGPGQSTDGPNPRCLAAGQIAATDWGIGAAAIVEGLLNGGLAQLGIDDSIDQLLQPGSTFLEDAQGPTMAGTLYIASQPDPSGSLGQMNYLRFNSVTWFFQDSDRTINLTDEEVIPADDIPAAVVFHPQLDETYALLVSPYGMDVNYGELLIAAVNQIVMPVLIEPSLTSFEDLFVYLLDCEQLAARLLENYAVPDTVTQGICQSLEITASSAIDSWLTGRVSSTSNHFSLNTPDDDPCPLGFSLSGDFLIQSMGGPAPGDHCAWQGEVREGSQDPEGAEVTGDWWAELL